MLDPIAELFKIFQKNKELCVLTKYDLQGVFS